MSGTASVEDQNPKVAPVLTLGKVTPEILHRWERACKEYFRVKSVSEKKKVESVLSRLQDFRIADWAEANEGMLRALDFAAFMVKLREEVLEKDWDRKIKLSILASKQGERPFDKWVYLLQTRNALLRGRACHFDDGALRETLENNMDQGLELRMRRVVVADDVSLRGWIEAVKVEDEFMVRERGVAKEMAREMFRTEQQRSVRGGGGVGRPVVSAGLRSAVGSGSGSTQRPALASMNGPPLPKLTPAE